MNEDYLKEWVRKAEEDFQVTVTLSRQREKLTPNAICFHSQQCAEKYLKAYLTYKEKPFPRIHDLLELQKYCLEVDPSFAKIGDWLDVLNPYSVEFRYPGEEANKEEANTALQMIKSVRQFVRKRLPLE